MFRPANSARVKSKRTLRREASGLKDKQGGVANISMLKVKFVAEIVGRSCDHTILLSSVEVVSKVGAHGEWMRVSSLLRWSLGSVMLNVVNSPLATSFLSKQNRTCRITFKRSFLNKIKVK